MLTLRFRRVVDTMSNTQINWLVYYQGVIVGIHNATFITEFVDQYGPFVMVTKVESNRVFIAYPENEAWGKYDPS